MNDPKLPELLPVTQALSETLADHLEKQPHNRRVTVLLLRLLAAQYKAHGWRRRAQALARLASCPAPVVPKWALPPRRHGA
jgi:hypothetical protein